MLCARSKPCPLMCAAIVSMTSSRGTKRGFLGCASRRLTGICNGALDILILHVIETACRHLKHSLPFFGWAAIFCCKVVMSYLLMAIYAEVTTYSNKEIKPAGARTMAHDPVFLVEHPKYLAHSMQRIIQLPPFLVSLLHPIRSHV